MNARQREIFEQLTTGIDIHPRYTSPPSKRPQAPSPTSAPPQISKKPKHGTKGAVPIKGEQEGEKGSRELEAAAQVRKEHGIKVRAPRSTPFPEESFEALQEREKKLDGLIDYAQKEGFEKLTPIQMQAIPALLEGRDVVGIAPTGSGKTLAFLIPLLARLSANPSPRGQCIRALVISPTCELSHQTHHTFNTLMQSLFGNDIPLRAFLLDKTSKKKLKSRHPDVLFVTPFALVKQIQKGAVDATAVEFLVLDEVDRLFSMEKGSKASHDVSDLRHYVAQLDTIVSACPSQHMVKAFFSATFPPHVSDLAANVLVDPVHITVGKKNAAVPSVKQQLLYTGTERGKLLAVRQIFARGIQPPVVIFVDTKQRAQSLMSELKMEGIKVACMHSEMPGRQRNAILQRFQRGQIWVLIATDLVSRGIDFIDVNVVINYDFPKSTMDYIHRIGRTGRAGKTGESYTFFTDGDRGFIRPIANTIKETGGEVPEWMTSLKKENWKNKRSYGAVGMDKEYL